METTPSSVPITSGAVPIFGTRVLPLRFTGSAGEFFRIWIVNLALTILTLGIYGAWAKVRTRRYFYGHTWLDGHNFEYTARPLAILIGHLIVGALFAMYSFTSNFGADETYGFSWVALLLLLVFFLALPYLVFKSLRFTARNTMYRGLRFHFHGSLAEAYGKFLGWPLLVPFTFGLLYPFVNYLQRQYMAGNAAYGSARTTFNGRVGDVYIAYLIGFALSVASYTVFIVLLLLIVGLFFLGGLTVESLPELLEDPVASVGFAGLLVLGAFVYLAFLLSLTGVTQYVKATLMNYTLNHTQLGSQVRFDARISPWMLAWIQVSNVVAQFFTLGLATPWAAVRRARYVLSCISLVATGSLDDFTGQLSERESALGEAATDFFDIDLGF